MASRILIGNTLYLCQDLYLATWDQQFQTKITEHKIDRASIIIIPKVVRERKGYNITRGPGEDFRTVVHDTFVLLPGGKPVGPPPYRQNRWSYHCATMAYQIAKCSQRFRCQDYGYSKVDEEYFGKVSEINIWPRTCEQAQPYLEHMIKLSLKDLVKRRKLEYYIVQKSTAISLKDRARLIKSAYNEAYFNCSNTLLQPRAPVQKVYPARTYSQTSLEDFKNLVSDEPDHRRGWVSGYFVEKNANELLKKFVSSRDSRSVVNWNSVQLQMIKWVNDMNEGLFKEHLDKMKIQVLNESVLNRIQHGILQRNTDLAGFLPLQMGTDMCERKLEPVSTENDLIVIIKEPLKELSLNTDRKKPLEIDVGKKLTVDEQMKCIEILLKQHRHTDNSLVQAAANQQPYRIRKPSIQDDETQMSSQKHSGVQREENVQFNVTKTHYNLEREEQKRQKQERKEQKRIEFAEKKLFIRSLRAIEIYFIELSKNITELDMPLHKLSMAELKIAREHALNRMEVMLYNARDMIAERVELLKEMRLLKKKTTVVRGVTCSAGKMQISINALCNWEALLMSHIEDVKEANQLYKEQKRILYTGSLMDNSDASLAFLYIVMDAIFHLIV